MLGGAAIDTRILGYRDVLEMGEPRSILNSTGFARVYIRDGCHMVGGFIPTISSATVFVQHKMKDKIYGNVTTLLRYIEQGTQSDQT